MDLKGNHDNDGLRCDIAARANDLITCLANTQRLTIVYTGKPDGTQELEPHPYGGMVPESLWIKAVLDRGTGGRTSRQLTMTYGNMASLRWLASSSMMSMEDEGRAGTPKRLENEQVATILRSVMPDFASILTSLSVCDFQTSEQDLLRDFLRIPKCLQHFSLLRPENWSDEPRDYWSLGVFFSMLKPQQETLKTLTLQHLSKFGQAGFGGVDLTSFTSLESLYLYHSDTGFATEAAEVMLQAPRLRAFIWNVHDVLMNDFRPEYQEAFLRELGMKASARGHPLEHIIILFLPVSDPKSFGYRNCPDEYPWDRLDRLRDELGIRLTYLDPTISREEYARALRMRDKRRNRQLRRAQRRNGGGVR